jgi:hypothetical protein
MRRCKGEKEKSVIERETERERERGLEEEGMQTTKVLIYIVGLLLCSAIVGKPLWPPHPSYALLTVSSCVFKKHFDRVIFHVCVCF